MKMGAAVCCAAQPELPDELLDELPPEPPVAEPEALVLRVVLPTVLVKVDEPDVTVVRTASVETADDELFPPEPPAPPTAL
jgi:hypothetical protein